MKISILGLGETRNDLNQCTKWKGFKYIGKREEDEENVESQEVVCFGVLCCVL